MRCFAGERNVVRKLERIVGRLHIEEAHDTNSDEDDDMEGGNSGGAQVLRVRVEFEDLGELLAAMREVFSSNKPAEGGSREESREDDGDAALAESSWGAAAVRDAAEERWDARSGHQSEKDRRERFAALNLADGGAPSGASEAGSGSSPSSDDR